MLEVFYSTYLVNRALFNICMPYTSQDEIATAVKSTVQKCVDGELQPEFVHTLSYEN
jgi:undecaprenyl pyrophosphate synthase